MTSNSQEEQFLIEARKKYVKAIRNLAKERLIDLRKYSIEQDENGNDYVLVNTDQEQFYTTNNVKKLKSIANEYYKNNIQGNVYVLDDKNYTTNAKSKKKYVGDINTLKNDIKRLKLRMLPELPNIIKVAQTINSDDDTKGKHNFSKDGWEYKKAIVRYEGNDYEVLLNVGKNDNTRTVYDINNIKKIETPLKHGTKDHVSVKGVSIGDNRPQEKSYVNNKMKKSFSFDPSQINTRSFQNTVQVAPSIHKDFAQSIKDEINRGAFAYEVIGDKDSLARVNNVVKNGNLDRFLYDLELKLNEGKRLTKDDMVMGQRLIQEYIKAGDSEKAMHAVSLTAEAGTQAGQAVQAMSMMRRLTPEGQLMALNRLVSRLSNQYVKPGEQEIRVSKVRAKDILMSDTPERLEQAVERAKEDVYNQVPVTMMDKINAWRYLSMLGNPKTHIRNIVGNAVFYPTRMIKNQIARGFESAFIKGEKTKSFLTPKDRGLVELGKYDYSLNESIIKGESKYADSKIMYNRQVFNNRALEAIREFNFEWLEKEDNFFIKKVYAWSFAGYLKANGIKVSDVVGSNGHIVNSQVLTNARNYAMKEAQKATYYLLYPLFVKKEKSMKLTYFFRNFLFYMYGAGGGI